MLKKEQGNAHWPILAVAVVLASAFLALASTGILD